MSAVGSQDAAATGPGSAVAAAPVRAWVHDETLREGLQAPSVHDPEVAVKIRHLELLTVLGVQSVCIGMPAAHGRAAADALALLQHVARKRAPLQLVCAAPMRESAVVQLEALRQRSGQPLWANLFLSAAPARCHLEGWSLSEVQRRLSHILQAAADRALPICFVAEDASRTPVARLQAVLQCALEAGATRVCLCDSAGLLRPSELVPLCEAVHGAQARAGCKASWQWHGHNDRGLALATALEAHALGAGGVHVTLFGLGERAGLVPLEQWLVNLALQDEWPWAQLQALGCELGPLAHALGVALEPHRPVCGRDVFTTAAGMHGALRVKAATGESPDLAFSPAQVGRQSHLALGPWAGHHMATAALQALGLPHDAALADALLQMLKTWRDSVVLPAASQPAPALPVSGRADA